MTVHALETGPLMACPSCVSVTWGQPGGLMLYKRLAMMSSVSWSAARQPGACVSATWTRAGRLGRGSVCRKQGRGICILDIPNTPSVKTIKRMSFGLLTWCHSEPTDENQKERTASGVGLYDEGFIYAKVLSVFTKPLEATMNVLIFWPLIPSLWIAHQIVLFKGCIQCLRSKESHQYVAKVSHLEASWSN